MQFSWLIPTPTSRLSWHHFSRKSSLCTNFILYLVLISGTVLTAQSYIFTCIDSRTHKQKQTYFSCSMAPTWKPNSSSGALAVEAMICFHAARVWSHCMWEIMELLQFVVQNCRAQFAKAGLILTIWSRMNWLIHIHWNVRGLRLNFSEVPEARALLPAPHSKKEGRIRSPLLTCWIQEDSAIAATQESESHYLYCTYLWTSIQTDFQVGTGHCGKTQTPWARNRKEMGSSSSVNSIACKHN